MILSQSALLQPITVQSIQLDKPPCGLAVLRAPRDVAALLDANIQAAILLPKNRLAAAYLCDRLDDALADCQPSQSNKRDHTNRYVKFDIGYHYKSISGCSTFPRLRPTPLEHKTFADDPLWQIAAVETNALTACLADAFIRHAEAPYVDVHIARWTDARSSSQLHIDRQWQLTATQCEAPTIVEIEGQEYQGPDYCVTLFKGNKVRHRADLRHPVSPERPRTQLCWDIGRYLPERMLD